MIKEIDKSEIAECVNVIRKSFQTIADDFGFTVENAPRFTAFATTEERLLYQLENEPRFMAAYYDEETLSRLRIHDLVTSTNYLTSFMIASKLYVDTINDQEEGLKEYKDLMTSSKDNLEDFLKSGNVNFLEDNSSYELLKLQSQIAYKRLVK